MSGKFNRIAGDYWINHATNYHIRKDINDDGIALYVVYDDHYHVVWEFDTFHHAVKSANEHYKDSNNQ